MKVITLEQAINEIKRLYNDECIPCSTSHTICEDLQYELKEFDAIPIPDNATNYDVLKAVFGEITTFRIKDSMEYEKGFELWFSEPYKGVEE